MNKTICNEILHNAHKTLADAGYQVYVPVSRQSIENGQTHPWFYILDPETGNFLYLDYDFHFGEWHICKPYVPSRENGSCARLNDNGTSILPLEDIARWMQTINTPADLARVNHCLKPKSLKFYKDFDHFKQEHLDKATHVHYTTSLYIDNE